MDSQPDRSRDLTASSPPPPPPPQPPGGPARMGACMGRCVADKSSCLKRWRSTDENETELMTDEEEDNTQRRKKKERKLIFRIIKFKRKDRKQFLEKFLERQDLNYSRLSSAPAAELTDIQLQSLDAQTLLVTAAKDITTTNCFAPAVSSRTSSSLDLEWEHEYGQHNHHHNRALSRSWLFIDGAAAEAAEDYEDDNKPLFNSPPSDDGCLRDELQLKQQRSSVHGQSSSSAAVAAKAAAANGQQQPNFTRTSSRTSWSHISTPESLEWDIDEEQRNQMQLEDDNLDHETLELLHQIEMLKNKVLNETGDGLDGIEFACKGRSAADS